MIVDDQGPVFVLGTGRCGSTWVQKYISQHTSVWVWGEHDGFLTKYFQFIDSIKKSQTIRNFSFKHLSLPPNERLSRGDTVTAWMLPFSEDDLEAEAARFVESMFSKGLPSGRDRWGFKEIRYGAKSGVPARLVRLFPNCRIAHIVRDPLATADSSMRAWHRDQVINFDRNGQGADALEEIYRGYLQRWSDNSAFFNDLENRYPQNVKTFKIEELRNEMSAFLEFIKFRNGSDAPTMDGNNEALSISSIPDYKAWVEKKSFEERHVYIDQAVFHGYMPE